MSTIKIFLACSAELKNDRKEFENFIGRENKTLHPKGVFLHLEIWEDFLDAISKTRLQDEYNKKIQEADIFVMLFFTKVGMYTSEEFDKALEQFKKANKPLIYTYFKNGDIKIGNLNRIEINSLFDFQEKLKSLGHFQTVYENEAELNLHFKRQLDELFTSGRLKITPTSQQTPTKCLSAGQPSVPLAFVGRDIELADIRTKLEKYGLLLIYAEGGMGKTTLAAKYLTDNLDRYKHYAWLFCDKGITEQIKTLATPLGVDLAKHEKEDDQLLAIKTAMQNLPKDCLLILDNANEPKHINDFQKHFGGLQWHILLTSRCQQVLPENEYILDHLKPEQATALFKTYHNENTGEFESLLDNFLVAIGYNTLMIELFSKNMHELSAIGEALADVLEQFREKGLFLGERSFEIRTAYTSNVQKAAVTTDQIIEVLYDLTKLEEAERHVLVNLALLPAESHLLTLLINVLTPGDKFNFAKQLKILAQKGWLNTDAKSYRMSPVVQQILLSKNRDRIGEDAVILVSNLNEKLEYDGALVNLRSYTLAQPFAEMATSVTGFLNDDTFNTALLLLNLSDYYKGIGNFEASLKHLIKGSEIFEKVDKGNYSVCLSRLGNIYQQQGDFKKALQFFEQDLQLTKELFEANPNSESIKNGLAISYERLGDIYQQRGDFKKALEFFEQETELFEELFKANPNSESLKKGLATSYERLGDIYQQQGDFKKALEFFEQETELFAELFKTNPYREDLKYGLASSYERLGHIYQQQGDFKESLRFYGHQKDICQGLAEINPDSVGLQEGLGDSYANVGDAFIKSNALENAKINFENAKNIFEKLTKGVPEAIEYKKKLQNVKGKIKELNEIR